MMMALFGPLAMNAQTTTTLLNQNFDGNGLALYDNTYDSRGWYTYNAGNGNNWQLEQNSTYAHSGEYSMMYSYSSSNAANCYLVSEPFSVSANMTQLNVSLYEVVRSATWAETFEVFFVKASDVTTLAGVASATHYNAIASATYTNTSYAQVTGSVTSSALKGQSVRVVVHCTSAANKWQLYIDDITVTETTGAVSTYTVTYNANGGTGTMTDSNSPYTSGSTVTVLTNTFDAPSGMTFSGWNTAANGSGTSYSPGATFTISANTTLYAQWVVGCDYSEDFENVSGASSGYSSAGSLPTGWDQIYTGDVNSTTAQAPHVHNGSSYPGPGSGTNALSGYYLGFYGTGNNSNSYAIMPAFASNEAASHISFKYRYENTSYGTLSYGVIDGTDASTYVVLGTCSTSTNPGLVDVDLSTSQTAGKRLAFRWNYSASSWYTAGIDEICVMTETVSNCPAPTDLAVSNITPNTATLSWNGEAESYNVRYRATSNGFSYNFESATPWAVDNFPPCTTYDGDGYMSGAIQDVTFENQNYTGSFIAFQNGITTNASSHSGNAFGACFFATTAPNDDYFILPAITIENGYVFKFWAKSFSTSFLESFRAGVYNGNGNLTAVLGSNTSVSNTWTEYSYNLSSYVGQTIQLAIHCNSNDRFAFFIDDIFVGDPSFTPTWSEPITEVTSPYILTGLDSETEYEFQVQADCGTDGVSQWSASATFTTLNACAVPTGMNATNITASTATLSWTGFTDTYNIQYREFDPTAPVTLILNVPTDIWNDGTGYQLILDADHITYGTTIPETGNFTAGTFANFEYTIPENAECNASTTTIIVNGSATITIPAGVYDYAFLNPDPGSGTYYIASNGGVFPGRGDDYEFEAGKTYEFTLSINSSGNDAITPTITDNGLAWTLVEGVNNPHTLQNLNSQTTYQYQIQGVDCDGNGATTDWSTLATFTTLNGYTVTATADPAGSGTFAFTGSDVVSSNANWAQVNPNGDVTITATATAGYTFMNWAEGGSVVSTTNVYTLTGVNTSHDLTAHFVDMTASNTWPAAVTTLAAATPGYSESGDNITISNANGLAWLISTVNGLNGQSTDFSGKTITLTADVDMSAHVWVPIGTTERPFTCTFEGNGHVITGVTRSDEFPHNGLFGYVSNAANIQNVVVQATLTGNSITTGAIAGTFASTGTISNVEGAGTLTGGALTETMGGLVGNNTNGTIHSSFAVNTITASETTTHLGGLVGNNAGNLYNSYANATMSGSNQIGGLVGKNNGTVENCYAIVGSQTFPAFAYENAEGGSIQICYTDNANGYVNTTATGTPTPILQGHGTYGIVKDRKAIGYLYDDNAVTLVSGQSANNSYVSSALSYNTAGTQIEKWPGLLSALNQWVKGHSGYTSWFRPTSNLINGDLPVLGFPSDNCLGTIDADGKYLAYGSTYNNANGLDDLLYIFNNNVSDAASSLFLYGSATEVSSVPESQVKVFVNEDAVLLQASGSDNFINTTVGITFDNSWHKAHAYPGGDDAPVLTYDWHMMSTPLRNAKIGASYSHYIGDTYTPDACTETSTVVFQNSPADIASLYNSYFPNGLVGQNSIGWDFYSFFEPEYHWVNLKRNKNNHFHQDSYEDVVQEGVPYQVDLAGDNYRHYQFEYTESDQSATKAGDDDCVFIPGKGYMMAISQDSYMSSTGTLNNGNVDISIPLTMMSPQDNERGCNLLGNPYQAYLDMNLFCTKNNSYLGNSYWVYIAEADNYVAGNCTASTNYALPSITLHPHQAFFVKTNTDGVDAVFEYDMATDTSSGYSYFRSGKIDYTLVNLFATNEQGQKDLVVIEVDRPETDGSPKMRALSTSNFELYARTNGQDYSILFTEEGTERVAVGFKAKVDGTYTLTWDTQNGHFNYLQLIDNVTGDKRDMLATDHYTFEGHATDLATRFYVVFKTDNNGDDDENDIFAFFDGNDWVVNGQGTLQLIDVTGRILYSKSLSGETTTRMHFDNFAAGVYMLRMVNSNKVIGIQKIVIE